jgi:hypothetical protein
MAVARSSFFIGRILLVGVRRRPMMVRSPRKRETGCDECA